MITGAPLWPLALIIYTLGLVSVGYLASGSYFDHHTKFAAGLEIWLLWPIVLPAFLLIGLWRLARGANRG